MTFERRGSAFVPCEPVGGRFEQLKSEGELKLMRGRR